LQKKSFCMKASDFRGGGIMGIKAAHIDGTTLMDTWFQLLYQVWHIGRKYKIDTGSYAGQTRLEFDFVSGMARYPHERPLAPIMPEGIPVPTTDGDIEKYFANYLMDYNLEDHEHYRYSSWINLPLLNIHAKIVDSNAPFRESQLEWVIRHFKEKGYGNNHCFINIGNLHSNFAYDKPYRNESERLTSPCLRGIDFKIKGGKLIVGVIFRSWDLYSGWPENMGGFTLLNEYVAEQLDGVEAGPLCFTSMGLHCYDFQIEPLKQILRIE